MKGWRLSLRIVLFLGIAAALVRKLSLPVEGPVLGGAFGTTMAIGVEVVVLALLLCGRDAAAGLSVCGLCAAGVLLAFLQPTARCGCFGAGIDRGSHLMFAGTLGVLACALTLLSWPAPARRLESFAAKVADV
ncbi:MAG: hypothetical protein R3F56_17795 [Planctomycetota bacterium]